MLGNFPCVLSPTDIFQNELFQKILSISTIRVSNRQQNLPLADKELEQGVAEYCVLVVNFLGHFSYKNCLDWCCHI